MSMLIDRDPLYSRAMGMRYEPEEVQRMVADGVSGYTEPLDRSNGFELSASDLYISSPTSTPERSTAPQTRAERIDEIDYEIYEILSVPATDETIEEVLMLEVEKAMLTEEIAIELVANNPVDTERLMKQLSELEDTRAEALRDYLVMNLMERGESGEPVDDEMFAEAAVLSDYIAHANPDETAEGLVAIAEAMHEALVARCELNRLLTEAI